MAERGTEDPWAFEDDVLGKYRNPNGLNKTGGFIDDNSAFFLAVQSTYYLAAPFLRIGVQEVKKVINLGWKDFFAD